MAPVTPLRYARRDFQFSDDTIPMYGIGMYLSDCGRFDISRLRIGHRLRWTVGIHLGIDANEAWWEWIEQYDLPYFKTRKEAVSTLQQLLEMDGLVDADEPTYCV